MAAPGGLQAAVGEAGGDAVVGPAANRMANLIHQQKNIEAQKKANQKAIKNEQRKRKRLMAKAKELSTTDLAEVWIVRSAAEAKAKAKAKAKASNQARADA